MTFEGMCHSHHEDGRVVQVTDLLLDSKVEGLHSLHFYQNMVSHHNRKQYCQESVLQCRESLKSLIYAQQFLLKKYSSGSNSVGFEGLAVMLRIQVFLDVTLSFREQSLKC